MVNFKLGTILSNLAEVSKNKDTDPKRVIEYTKAARTIRDYPGEIEAAYSNGTLRNLPGINEEVYGLLEEYFRTGKISAYEELKELYSEELIMFIRISGLGKRRIFSIYDLLGIKDLSGLKECVEDKTIYSVLKKPSLEKGFITKTHIERLISSLDYYESTAKLYPKGYIDFFIGKMKQKISRLKDIRGVFITGSLRRKKPFVGDIDLIILPEFNTGGYDHKRSEELLKSMAGLDFIDGLKSLDIRKDNTSARFDTKYGADLEAIVSCPGSIVFDLFYTTGCKAHIRKVEEIAKSKGYFMEGRITLPADEKGIFEDAGEEDIEKAESYIYETLGLQFIPPELREANDEVELASTNRLPYLVKLEDIKGDLHIHSIWSDGMMEIEDIEKKAKDLDYGYIAITDHSSSNVYGNGLDSERMIRKIEFLNNYRTGNRENKKASSDKRAEAKRLGLLIGGEVDIRAIGRLDYNDEILEEMDIVIASMHSNYLNTVEENTMRIVSALENRYVDALAHPTGVVFGSRAPYTLDMERIFSTAVKHNKSMEINSYLLRLDLSDRLVREFKAMGGKLMINTDSHRIANLDMICLGVEVARRAGLTKEDVVNTMQLGELMKWKKRR